MTRLIPEAQVPHRNGVTCWWSSVKRNGEWILPRIYRVFTFMGNVELDLTTALIGPGETEIDIRCIMANVEIKVPAEVRVLCEGEGILGTFEVTRIGEIPPLPFDAPTIRIEGDSYMGNVSIQVIGIVGPSWKDKLKAWSQLNS